MAWTTLDLLTTIKNRAMFPDASSGSLGTATLLQFGTEELLIRLVPLILGVREKYYETFVDTLYTPLTTSLAIPSRAIGGTLSSVQFLYGPDIKQLHPIDPAMAVTSQPTAWPTNFYFQNNAIVPYPPPSASQGTVRMRYFQRPNRLEQTSNCAQVTAFDSVGLTVTCASVPSAWATTNLVDFIPQTASQATPYGLNSAITNVSGSVLTFAALPSALAVGDWIALAEYTPIPEVPFEFQAVLAQSIACAGLEAINDQTGLAVAKAKLTEYEAAAVKLLTPRDQQGLKKVVSSWKRW